MTVDLRSQTHQRAFLKAVKIERLKLVYKNFFCGKEVLQHQQWHFWYHLNSLKCLQSLEISMEGLFIEHMLLLIKKLNDNPVTPSIIKVEFIFYGKTSIPQNLNSQHILQFQKFFAKTTHFTINEDIYQTFADRWCLSDPNCFEKLRSLSITKKNKGADPLPLQHLSTSFAHFEKLQHIHLSLEFYSSRITFQDFLQDFSLPSSITSVSLKLAGLSWQTIIPDISMNGVDSNPFENHQLCLHFYQKWRNLCKLTSLSVYFSDISGPFIPGFYFFAPLVKYLHQIQTLIYSNRYRFSQQKRKYLDFSQFWNSLKPLAPTLEELNIQDFAISFQNFHAALGDVQMPNFKNLYIEGFIIGLDKNLKNLLQIFQNKSTGPKNLNIQSIVIQEAQNSLLHLLKALSHYSFTASLVLDARKIDSETIVSNLLHFISHNSSFPKASLIIENAKRFHKPLKNKLLKALKNQKVISSLEISSPNGNTKLIYGNQLSDMDYEPSLLEWEDDENGSGTETENSSDSEVENTDFDLIDLEEK